MKKTLHQFATVILLAVFALLSSNSNATVHNVSVADFSFTPSVLINVFVGDTIHWQWTNGTHTTTSVSIPASAPTWDVSMTSSNQTFDYRVTVAGVYTYNCTFHAPGMAGSFTAQAPSGVAVLDESEVNLDFFPNPVKETIGVSFNLVSGGSGMVKVYDLLGKLSMEFAIEAKTGRNTVNIPADELQQGIYIAELYIGSTQFGIQRIIKN